LKGKHPSFLLNGALTETMQDWSYLFHQRDGNLVAPESEVIYDVYHVASLHQDNICRNSAWMVVLEGQKRFWLAPPSYVPKGRIDGKPYFVTSSTIKKANFYGL
jgi:hypothetical protein